MNIFPPTGSSDEIFLTPWDPAVASAQGWPESAPPSAAERALQQVLRHRRRGCRDGRPTWCEVLHAARELGKQRRGDGP
jgi:hypothetical protein